MVIPRDVFHSLLEPENARFFIDAYLEEAPLRADRVFWVATANDESELKSSLIDRFLVLRVDQTDADGQAAMLQQLYEEALAQTQAPLSPTLDQANPCLRVVRA